MVVFLAAFTILVYHNTLVNPAGPVVRVESPPIFPPRWQLVTLTSRLTQPAPPLPSQAGEALELFHAVLEVSGVGTFLLVTKAARVLSRHSRRDCIPSSRPRPSGWVGSGVSLCKAWLPHVLGTQQRTRPRQTQFPPSQLGVIVLPPFLKPLTKPTLDSAQGYTFSRW